MAIWINYRGGTHIIRPVPTTAAPLNLQHSVVVVVVTGDNNGRGMYIVPFEVYQGIHLVNYISGFQLAHRSGNSLRRYYEVCNVE